MREQIGKVFWVLSTAICLILVVAPAGCLSSGDDDDDSDSISCAEDDVCQPDCADDPDCAATDDDDDDNNDDTACTDGEYSCGVYPDETLFLCNDGQLQEVMDCADCPYVGPGTGIEDDSNCKFEPLDEPSENWDDDYTYYGPGCYFGFTLVCGLP